MVKIGCSDDGRDVFIDRNAAEADGIIVSCRIKYHHFRGAYESGIMKMMAIGLGKQVGAGQCHADGYGRMAGEYSRFWAHDTCQREYPVCRGGNRERVRRDG